MAGNAPRPQFVDTHCFGAPKALNPSRKHHYNLKSAGALYYEFQCAWCRKRFSARKAVFWFVRGVR